MSCASVGDCSAGGDYSGRGAGAFVVTEQHGIWGTAKQVPGPARLGGGALMQSVSCGSAGNCSVGRSYGISNVPPTGSSHAFVVSEQHGIWGNAKTFPVQRSRTPTETPDRPRCRPARGIRSAGGTTLS